MNRNVVLALLAGFVGGMITHYIDPITASAQDHAQIVKEVRAQSFALVDSTDRVIGTFSTEPIPGVAHGAPLNLSTKVVLRDSSGRAIWSAGGSGLQPLTTQLYSK